MIQGIDIVNRLKEILPKHTNDFSTFKPITSLSRSGNIITATVAGGHGYKTDDYVTISGALEPITITEMVKSGDILTITTATHHKLSDPSNYSSIALPRFIALSGNIPTDYNGSFELLTVPDNLNFTVKVNPSFSNPIGFGNLLLPDFDGYNAYKKITVISSTAFTYPIATTNLQTPAAGTIQASKCVNIDHAATPEILGAHFNKNEIDIYTPWIYVVVGAGSAYKNDISATDISAMKSDAEDYYYETQNKFSLFLFLPSQNSILGGDISDNARKYLKHILKSLGNCRIKSDLSDEILEAIVFEGEEPEGYVGAYYTHRFDFSARGKIQRNDVSEEITGTPLQIVDYALDSPVNMISKVLF